MKPNFYCRQLRMQLSRNRHPEMASLNDDFLRAERGTIKFSLPMGGRMLGDELEKFEGIERIEIPYSKIALEYEMPSKLEYPRKAGSDILCSRRIVLAEDHGEAIRIRPAFYINNQRNWMPWGVYHDVSKDLEFKSCRHTFSLMTTPFLSKHVRPSNPIWGALVSDVFNHKTKGVGECSDEITTFVDFCMAIKCGNISTETIKQGHLRIGKKTRPSHNGDTYKVLVLTSRSNSGRTLDRDGRSPREHLRRGHIRRLRSGKTIWINSAIVNAGKSNGRVFKDYRMAKA